MALTAEKKKFLATLTLPSDAETAKRAQMFRQLSGMTLSELAEATGYAPASLSVYLLGHYGNNLTAKHEGCFNTRAIRYALKQYIDQWDDAATQVTLAPPHLTGDFVDIRKACFNALKGGVAYVLDGPPGSQKTFSLRTVRQEINEGGHGLAIRIYARVDHSPHSFLQECCNEAGISNRGQIDQLIRKLRFFLSKPRVLLMVDEAQHLDNKGLEILRQLLEENRFGVVMAGHDDLSRRLNRWDMEKWHSRVRKTLYLDGPSRQDARAILRAELGPMADAECDETIDACKAKSKRTVTVKGNDVCKEFTYTSARDLFGAIERAKEVLPQPQSIDTQKAGAA